MSQLLGVRGPVTQRCSEQTNNTNGFPEKLTAHSSSSICDCMQSPWMTEDNEKQLEYALRRGHILKLWNKWDFLTVETCNQFCTLLFITIVTVFIIVAFACLCFIWARMEGGGGWGGGGMCSYSRTNQAHLYKYEKLFGSTPSGIIAHWMCVGFLFGPESIAVDEQCNCGHKATPYTQQPHTRLDHTNLETQRDFWK